MSNGTVLVKKPVIKLQMRMDDCVTTSGMVAMNDRVYGLVYDRPYWTDDDTTQSVAEHLLPHVISRDVANIIVAYGTLSIHCVDLRQHWDVHSANNAGFCLCVGLHGPIDEFTVAINLKIIRLKKRYWYPNGIAHIRPYLEPVQTILAHQTFWFFHLPWRYCRDPLALEQHAEKKDVISFF